MTDTARLWSEWSEAWREDPTPVVPARVREGVDRETRRLRWLVAADVAITVTILSAARWILTAVGGHWVLFAAALLHTALVWAFTIWNRRGIWRPLAETTSAYVDLATTRCRRRLRTVRFMVGLVLVELAATIAWTVAVGFPLRALLPLAIFAVMLLWAAWYGRATRRELVVWRGLRGDPDPGSEDGDRAEAGPSP